MEQISIYQAKKDLSKILKKVAQGILVVINHHNKPVAELHPVKSTRHAHRPIGLCKHKIKMTETFNDALPESVLKDFE